MVIYFHIPSGKEVNIDLYQLFVDNILSLLGIFC